MTPAKKTPRPVRSAAAIQRAEAAAAGPDGSRGPLRVTVGGELFTLAHPGKWRLSAQRALRSNDFDGWAQAVMSDSDYARFVAMDPELDELEEAFRDVATEHGVSLPES